MPYEDDKNVPSTGWVLGQQPGTAITAVRLQNIGDNLLLMKAAVGEVPPVTDAGALRIRPNDLLSAEQGLDVLFPGTPGANRVYLKGETFGTRASISHG